MTVLLLAFRYLRTRLMAHLAVVFLAVAVLAMIVVTAVMAGFQERIRRHVRGTTPDLTVHAGGPEDPRGAWETIVETLRPEMVAAGGPLAALAPRMRTVGLLGTRRAGLSGEGDAQHRVEVVGIDWESDREVLPWDRLLARARSPAFSVHAPSGVDPLTWRPQPGLFMGEILARKLGALSVPGAGNADQVTLFTPGIQESEEGPEIVPNNVTFRLAGCFDSGRDDHDLHHVYIPLTAYRQLQYAGSPEAPRATYAVARVREGLDVERVSGGLTARYPGLHVETWKERRASLMVALKVERTVTTTILFFIVLLAGLLLLGILYMIVLDKRRDVGILRSMGLSRAATAKVFLAYGGMLGLLGVGLGVGSGLLLVPRLNDVTAWLAANMGVNVFDPGAYRHRELPAVMDPREIGLIGGTSLLLTLGAAGLAAWGAVRPQPVECLRHE